MAYTIQEFIDRAETGGGVQIYNSVTASVAIDIPIGEMFLDMNTTTPYDLGKYFSAQQVLESYALRANIIDGKIIAEAGTTSLSLTPVV